MSLADLLKTFKRTNDKGIVGELDRFNMTKRKGADIGRPYETRAVGYHHPSSISSQDCLRSLVYGWLNTERSNKQENAKSQRIFDTGHDFGYRMQGYFWAMDMLLGEWLCIQCGHQWLDMDNPSPKKCPHCGADLEIWYNLHYLEVPFMTDKWAGKADGVIVRPFGRQLLEFKTIKNRDAGTRPDTITFDDLVEPKVEHRLQANFYLWLAGQIYGRKSDTDLIHGLVIYGGKNNHDLKEFPISLLEQDAVYMQTKADIVDSCIKDRVLPARLGTEPSCRTCKWCSYKDFCWQNESFDQADMRGKGEGLELEESEE